ncbi:flagellar basal body P-ring protein FlgI [bacterium]|nr:flagellar basal body P-ring protein FlgI [bacterium]
MRRVIHILLIIIILSIGTSVYPEVRIKDIANLMGVRDNQLSGYGLVVGLNGTGDKDQTKFTVQTLVNMLERLGVTIPASSVKVKNVASVIVTANLIPFAKSGSRIDVVVSSIGDAKSLQGGTLIQTPLFAANSEIYAVAQGPLSIGGFSAEGGGAGSQKNHPTVGLVPGGALVEREVPFNGFDQSGKLQWVLKNPDFTTISRLTDTIRKTFPDMDVTSEDSSMVTVYPKGKSTSEIISLISSIELLEVSPDTLAKVVLDERTGTIVFGENVTISTVAIFHGNLTIEASTKYDVSQPLPLSIGETVVVPESELATKEEKAKSQVIKSGTTIAELVSGLKQIGATPRDIIAIFQAIKAAGALNATLEII